jgi:hypothetical protein
MMPFHPRRRAVMPSLGLLTFAGALPAQWTRGSWTRTSAR